jgi:hypothetical protein
VEWIVTGQDVRIDREYRRRLWFKKKKSAHQSTAAGDGGGSDKLTSHGCIDVEQIGFGVQNLGRLFDDIERMILVYPPFPVKMVLKIGDVWFSLFCFGKELIISWDVHSWGLDLQLHSRRARMGQINVRKSGNGAGEKGERTSLTTRSCVLTV